MLRFEIKLWHQDISHQKTGLWAWTSILCLNRHTQLLVIFYLMKNIDVNSIHKVIDVRRNINAHALWLVNQLGYPIKGKFFGRE